MLGEIINTETTYKFFIGNEKLVYKDLPLSISYCHGDGSWGGRSNFKIGDTEAPPEKHIESLSSAFEWMARWKKTGNSGYKYGVVLDFESKTIYYDNQEALNFWKKHESNQYAFFEKFEEVEEWADRIEK
jgi:hypothetical protein